MSKPNITLVLLAKFDTNYIIFKNVENFQKLFLPNQKNILKENSEYLGIPICWNESFKIN
jgi:hypothetical protein